MKSVTEILAGRTSVRRYEREAIIPEDMTCIYEAVRNTPTSYNGQQFSVIDVDDQALEEQIYELTGQKQIKTCNRFLLFCIDYNKIALLARRKGVEMPPFTDTVDGLIVGCVDAALAMMRGVCGVAGLRCFAGNVSWISRAVISMTLTRDAVTALSRDSSFMWGQPGSARGGSVLRPGSASAHMCRGCLTDGSPTPVA